ncbi:MAG: DUF362 domain-containing protein, partial [bacterium]|nr:DUF362 domain-containing protein [bacterium]
MSAIVSTRGRSLGHDGILFPVFRRKRFLVRHASARFDPSAQILLVVMGIGAQRGPGRDSALSYTLIDGVSAATPPGMSVVGVIRSDYEQLAHPVPPDAELTQAQVEDMVRLAVDQTGGFGWQIPQDAEWVVIKVNIVEIIESGSGVITDSRMVKALIKLVHETVPEARISIVEGPAEWIPPETGGADIPKGIERVDGFAVAGYRQLLTDPELAGIDLDIIDLNFSEYAAVSVPDGGYAQDDWKLPLAILENDFLISAPVLKIHEVGMTSAMKNFIGVFPGLVYGWPKMAGYPRGSSNKGIPHSGEIIDETITDVVAMAEPDFALVDVIMSMERAKTGKFGGIQKRMNTIMASADVVAADAIGALLMGLNPADVEHVTLGARKGLGQADPKMIKVKGSPLEQVAMRFEKTPGNWGRHYGQGNRIWVLKGPIASQELVDGAEFGDVKNPNAVPGQDGWSSPVFFHDDKIDLDKLFDDPSNCVVYAYAEFDADRTQAAALWLGSDEGLKAWINGEPVYAHEGRRRHALPNDRQMIQIHEGVNSVLLRLEQKRGTFDFSLNICEPEPDPRYDGSRVAGLQFRAPAATGALVTQLQEITVAEQADQQIPDEAILLVGATVPAGNDRLLSALAGALQFVTGQALPERRWLGLSGHAFRFRMADSLAYSGTAGNLAEMATLYSNFGYRVRAIEAATEDADFMSKQLAAFEAIGASIDRGMPVVARLGRSHDLVVGYDPRREQLYSINGRNSSPEPNDLDELGAVSRQSAGGLEVVLLEDRQPVDERSAERASLVFAVTEAQRADEAGSIYHHGFSGFEHLADDIEARAVSSDRSLAYTIRELLDARTGAAQYVREISDSYAGKTADHLIAASDNYDREVAQLGKLSQMFPYRDRQAVDIA